MLPTNSSKNYNYTTNKLLNNPINLTNTHPLINLCIC